MVHSLLDMISTKCLYNDLKTVAFGSMNSIRAFSAKLYILSGLKVALLVLMFILAGCTPSAQVEEQIADELQAALPTQTPAPLPTPSPQPDTTVRGEVVIWVAYDPIELESLQAVIDAFTAQNPDIAFALAYYPEAQLLEEFQSLGTSGRRPTLLIGPSRWGPELFASGNVLDLGALIDPELEEDIYPSAWTQARSDFAVLGLPLEMKGVLLYRNQALAEESPATVAEWVAVQEKLANQQGLESQLDFGFTYNGAFLSSCGAVLEEPSDRSQLWGPAGLCWLELLRDLAINSKVVFNSDQDFEAFVIGESPWLIDLAERRAELQAALGSPDLRVNPWPVYAQQALPLRGYMWTENVYLAAGTPSRDLEATWAFARYLLSQEAQSIFGDPANGGHLPVNASVELTDPLMIESSAMLRSGVPWPFNFQDQKFLDELENAVVNVVQQGSEPEFALNFAQESLGLPITVIPTATAVAPQSAR